MRPDIILAMNDIFKSEVPRLVHGLKDAVRSNDMAEVIKHAHGITGAAARVGAKKLGDVTNKIEGLARAGDGAEIMLMLGQLDDLYFDALHEANKSALDQRIENVETSIERLQVSLDKSMTATQVLLKEHITNQEQILAIQTKSMVDLKETIEDTFRPMVETIAGKNQIPQGTMDQVVKTFRGIIIALTFVIVFLMTGVRFNFVPSFFGPNGGVRQEEQNQPQPKAEPGLFRPGQARTGTPSLLS